jgi:tetratricopeptide (TPR) repeat protein
MNLFHTVVSLEHHAQAAYTAHLYHNSGLLRSRAVSMAQHLDRPSLLAVLCLRLGDSLKADQALLDAAMAYESGFHAFLALPVNIQHMLGSLHTLRSCSFDRMVIVDTHDESTAQGLQSAATDPLLPVCLLLECAKLYELQSSMYLALQLYKQMLPYLKTDQTLELYTTTLAHVGALAYQEGEQTTLEATLGELLNLRHNRTDPRLRCHILAALASLYEAIGNVPLALGTYRQALKDSLIGGDGGLIGTIRGRLARISTQHLRTPGRQLRNAAVASKESCQLRMPPTPVRPETLRSESGYRWFAAEPPYFD